jgi:hypothetical protein
MSAREDIEKRIEKEKQKVSDLQKQIERSNAFIQGMREALQLISGNIKVVESPKETSYFRAGDTKNAYEILKQTGKSMHIDELLNSIGKPVNKQTRASLGSSLRRVAKRSGIVKCIGNSTFSLSDLINETTNIDKKDIIKLPDSFGSDSEQTEPKDIPF